MAMKVRELFPEPDRNEFCQECIRVGEALEALGYTLEEQYYTQGVQSLLYRKGSIEIDLHIDMQEEGVKGDEA